MPLFRFRRRPLAPLFLLLVLGTAHGEAFDPGLAGFNVNIAGLEVGYSRFPLFALPGQAVSITADPAGRFQVTAAAGTWQAAAGNRWTWTAPDSPGHYPIDIERADGAHLRLEAFVLVPASEVHHGRLKDYRIGSYPARPLNGLPAYQAPAGFVEVTPELAGVRISPHFTLGEFLCKQAGGYPKYLVLSPRLLLKLEALTAYLNNQGVPVSALHIMSGYRTPWYNRQLGDAQYSRHMWGDAADIYIDAVGDLRRVKEGFVDSTWLAAGFQQLFSEPAFSDLRGGIGTYAATANHAPFVHVDARGFDARW